MDDSAQTVRVEKFITYCKGLGIPGNLAQKLATQFTGNPVLDTNAEAGTNDTRDPKVFWYGPTRRWVMVLFENDGMSFFNSTDLKSWTRQSHFKGLHECPDFFELPVDGDSSHRKWILHGGSSTYFIGSFDGSRFTPESPALSRARSRQPAPGTRPAARRWSTAG